MIAITEFLLARIAEDETAAELGGWHNGGGTFANDNYGCLLVQPARVLAECAAKRAIVETCIPYKDHYFLCVIAAVYAEHPDYRTEWSPTRQE